jgi:uncharacterized protein
MIEIKLTKKVDLKDYVLIEGFPGIGLVGTIAAGYLVEKRKMEPIGYVCSDKFPPMTTIHQGRPYLPARLYIDPKKKICVILAEFVIPSDLVFRLAGEILEFAKANGIRQIVSLAGMTSAKVGAVPRIYAITSNDETAKYLKGKGIELIQEGVTTGVSGVLIAQCAVENFPAMSLLAESRYGYPDPRAASLLLEQLNGLFGTLVDTKALLGEADVVEEKMHRMLDQLKKVKTTYKKAEEEYPPMYR